MSTKYEVIDFSVYEKGFAERTRPSDIVPNDGYYRLRILAAVGGGLVAIEKTVEVLRVSTDECGVSVDIYDFRRQIRETEMRINSDGECLPTKHLVTGYMFQPSTPGYMVEYAIDEMRRVDTMTDGCRRLYLTNLPFMEL